ncbi:MAG: ABC transporter ATP-binding protein [Candidatus Dormiibacterota bacterium]
MELVELSRWFGPVAALDRFSLRIEPGELVALLGPSGCGKTTALRALGGLEQLDGGRVLLGGVDITNLAAHRRAMGMVFQAYSLFPNMTAVENVGFGLKMRKVQVGERRRRADALLELVGLSTQADRYPHQLSGGQQQRVALARALAIQPPVLLLDEPLSALDARVRGQLRDEIRRIQLEVGTTTLFVTHDQDEALSIADRVGVMRAGKLEQCDTPSEIYARPTTAFVAEFVGSVNRLPGVIGADHSVDVVGCRIPLPGSGNGHVDGSRVDVLVRPETVKIKPDVDGRGRVTSRHFLGPVVRIAVVLADGAEIVGTVLAAEGEALFPGTGVSVELLSAPLFVVEAADPA